MMKKAIAIFLFPAGKELDPCMPLQGISDEDPSDMLEYLKTLE